MENPIIDSVESFTDKPELESVEGQEFNTGADEPQEVNEQLAQFVSDFDRTPGDEPKEETPTEKLTAAAARVMIAQGANGLIMAVGFFTKTEISISATEIDCLSDDLAPLLVKYGSRVEDLPPWIKAVLKYKVELIALKGVCLFGYSVFSSVRHQRKMEAIAQEQAEAQKRNQEQHQEAA